MEMLIKELRLEEYIVRDLIRNEVKYIFILESPHIDEIKTKYPLSGRSGKTVSRILFDKEKSFGLLIQDKKINLNHFGIINVSQIPLQLEAYQCNAKNNALYSLVKKFETIRKNPNKRKRDTKYYKKEELNKLIDMIQKNFKNRIKKIDDLKNKKYIICGKFAKIYFKELNFDILEENLIYVPHPSFNNWEKKKYLEEIKQLKEFTKTTKHISE